MPPPRRNRSFESNSPYGFPPGVKWLILTNLAIFVAYFLSARTSFEALFYPLGLIPARTLHSLWLWQPFTYLFLHSPFDFWHILFNMLSLWMFGSPLEQSWGTRRFLKYYFVCGVGAGLCVVLAHLVIGDVTEAPRVIGASGAIFGLILAFGIVFAETTVMFSFLFPIKAKYMAMIFGGIAFLSSIRPMGDKVSNVAHLGGMLCGFLYLKPDMRWTSPLDSWKERYRDWKFQRNKKRFQVYLKKQNKRHDRTIH